MDARDCYLKLLREGCYFSRHPEGWQPNEHVLAHFTRGRCVVAYIAANGHIEIYPTQELERVGQSTEVIKAAFMHHLWLSSAQF